MKTTKIITMRIRMLFLLAIVLSFCITGKTSAQQDPQYSQYMFNMMSVNPAYTGTREALNALFLSRIQWAGLEGAPKTSTFALHTPIKEKRIGIGASVVTDNIGPSTNTYINLNYAHRIYLSENLSFSLGLKGGINNYAVNLTNLSLNENDNAFTQDFEKKFQPNFGVGAYLYSKKFYVGISVPKLLATDLNTVNSADDVASELKRHYFITGGYVIELNTEWKVVPSLLTKIVDGAPPSLDITAQVVYKDKFWMGTTYRIGDALVFLLEVQINRQLMAGYSYDLTISEMNTMTTGSHEILISYDFAGFTNDKVKSPRYF